MTGAAGASARRLPIWTWLVGLALVWPFVLPTEDAHRTGVQLLVLVLVGLSLTVTVGWLRVITLFQPAAVAAGAAVTAGLAAGGRSFVVALAAAAVAGAVTGLAALLPATGDPRRWLPATSLVLTAAGVLVVPRYVFRPFLPPTVLGMDLGGDRALYLVALVAAVLACLLVARIGHADLGRRLRVVGAEPGLAERSGVASATAWRDGLLLSGGLAGAAGCLTALLYQGLPSALEFSPTAAVAYLAIPLVGGTWLVGGAIVGAVVFLATARVALTLGLASVVLPAALVAVAALAQRPGGLAEWMRASAGPALLDRLRSR